MSLDRWLSIARLRLRTLFLHARVEDELREELEGHVEQLAEVFVAQGFSAARAREMARRQFGSVEQRRGECRDARGFALIEDFWQDVRHGCRIFAKSPGFTATVVFSLALAIAANVAIFSLFDALILKPIPVDRPHELRVLNLVLAAGGRDLKSSTMLPYRFLADVRASGDVFSDVLGFARIQDVELAVGEVGAATSGEAVFVSPNFFEMLGLAPPRGVLFTSTRSDAQRDVVLDDGFWRRVFGGRDSAIGSRVDINGVPFTVIGIAPRGFSGLVLGRRPDIYLRIEAFSTAQPGVATLGDRSQWQMHFVGRLKDGVADSVAADRLTTLHRSIEPAKPNQPPPLIRVLPMETGLSDVRQRFARPLSLLMGMVGLLLVVGCCNVATLLLSRTAARKGELALRGVLGAGRARLSRQLGTEALILVAAASVCGLVLSGFVTQAFVSFVPADLARGIEMRLDGRVFAFAILAAVVATLLAAVSPAVHALSLDVSSTLKERRPDGASAAGSLGRAFVTGQAALALVLVVAAALFVQTLDRLSRADPGFDPTNVLVVSVDPGARDYRDARLSAYYRDTLERLRSAPGIRAATLLQFSVLTDARTTGTISVPGFAPASDDDRWAQIYQVGPDFFATLGMRLLDGRDFNEEDFADLPRVAAINETAAKRFFATTNPIGSTIRGATTESSLQVIGVVRDARYNTLRDEPVAAVFVPYTTTLRRTMTFALRTDGSDAAQAAALTAVRAGDPLVPVRIKRLETTFQERLGQERLLARIAALFAASVVVLLALGLYGVMSFWVSARVSEIGVRMALGARRGQVLWSVLRHPIRLVSLGIAIGVVLVFAGASLIASLLFGVAPRDTTILSGSALLLLLIALASGIVPALKASRVDPVVTLKSG